MKPRAGDVKALFRAPSFSRQSICLSCRRSILRRHFASAAAAVDDNAAQRIPSHLAASSQDLRPAYQIHAGVVLSRPPRITRDLTSFEKAYFFYQRRLNERLSLRFTRYFYFKKGTPADLEWKRKIKHRLTAARDIGIYNPYTPEGWNDELLLGAKESEPEHQIDALLKDAETAVATTGDSADITTKEAVERPMPRTTEADKAGDEKSLDRLLQRTLYLLVKSQEGRWLFPSAILPRGEYLHDAAERILLEAAGENMNTWVVGNAPIGHYRFEFPKPILNPIKNTEELGEKVFFMKARIMAGQVDLNANKFMLADFKWLAKEEIQKLVTPRYWSKIEDMLADR